MSIHHFTLIVDGPDLQDDTLIDAVFEAGCGDAAIGRIDGIQYVDFDREAPSLNEAILSAVADIERTDDVDVVRILLLQAPQGRDGVAHQGEVGGGALLRPLTAESPRAVEHQQVEVALERVDDRVLKTSA